MQIWFSNIEMKTITVFLKFVCLYTDKENNICMDCFWYTNNAIKIRI